MYFGPVTIMFCCDLTVRESQKVIKICYNLNQKEILSSEERQELRNLINQVKINIPKFTAAGFFEIGRTTLFSFFGATTTYLIVIIQFHAL
ncbi:hypothetical protein NQ314_008509 [Rhamnusium bicolor]|uniref:Gustatory receptor n=1 Tax=Rhamnusium bicolor TaxID=1586634 RepID=A0AAV8Y951_9CUCU|nr:hypothetical protein NQ314_008509 [Rhamnusium bicolor]